jgi:hypothetical protein
MEEKLSENELRVKLRELEEESRLSRSGLYVGGISAMCAMFAVLASFSIDAKMAVVSGNHLVMIVGIVAGAIIVYFSFVFRRAARVRMEISKTKTALEMGSGEKV